MEKVTNNINNTLSPTIKENLVLDNRSTLKLNSVQEIIAFNDTNIFLKLKDTTMQISGSNLTITKLNVDEGTIEAEGLINLIKYGKSGNIFKRIFK